MIDTRNSRRPGGWLPAMAACIMAAALLSACGAEPRPDPAAFYKTWVGSVRSGDGGKVYDALDTTLRRNLDQDIERMKGQIPQMSGEQKALWENIQGLKGRAAYAKLIELNRDTVTANLSNDFQVLKVDTLVVMTVQHANQAPNIVYMRWENGGYHITEAPQVPIEMSADHPPAGGVPGGMPPSGGTPQGSVPGGTTPGGGAVTAPPAGSGEPAGK
jgi:hypothetical protein